MTGSDNFERGTTMLPATKIDEARVCGY